ncbi:MAG: hypothetical protein H7257_12280 [Taibaiella sp.]|nr:hypothetical protein [Taibaiella sp.]
MKKVALCLLLSAYTLCSYGQHGLYYIEHTYEEDPYDELSYYFAGGNFLSDNVYLGRKDSTKLPYLSTYAGYQFHNGIYAKATASYALTKRTGHFDLLTLELGYDRTFGQHLLTGVSIEKYFYQRNSPGVKAAIQESGCLYAQYKSAVIEPTASLTMNRSKATDVIVSLGIDHVFRYRENTLNLVPAIFFNYGSVNYYSQYFINRQLKKDHTLMIAEAVKDAAGYKPLDLEFSLRTTLRAGEWLFTLNPVYSVPLSAATITLPNKTIQEKLSSSLVIELDVCYRHERK